MINYNIEKRHKWRYLAYAAAMVLPAYALIRLEPNLISSALILSFYAGLAGYFSLTYGIVASLVLASVFFISATSTFVFGAAAVYGLLAISSNYIFNKAQLPDEKISKDEAVYDSLSGVIDKAQSFDFETQAHAQRVADNALKIGQKIGLNKKQLDMLYWAALLHDIGKESIPTEILFKPDGLTDMEYELVKKHANYGADVLASISPEYGEIAKIVRHHHERWDGSGYPNNLANKEIPLLSRIIAVADVYEALTGIRSYRDPMRPTDAAKYIVSSSGAQFDPQVVKAFELCYANKELIVADLSAEEPVDLLYDSQVVEPFNQPLLVLK